MLRTTTALALALLAWAQPAAAEGTPMSALGIDPARVDYLSNDAPFVLFDVSPRSLKARRSAGTQDVELSFIATDALRQVDISISARSGRQGEKVWSARTRCGARIAGYHRCTVATRDALLYLQEGEGLIGLRIEAEGAEGDRSTVQVLLPVKGVAARPLPAPVNSSLSLTPLAADPSR